MRYLPCDRRGPSQPFRDCNALYFTVYNCPRNSDTHTNLCLWIVRSLFFESWWRSCLEDWCGSKLKIVALRQRRGKQARDEFTSSSSIVLFRATFQFSFEKSHRAQR